MKTLILPQGEIDILYTSIENIPIVVKNEIEKLYATHLSIGFEGKSIDQQISFCQELVRLDKKTDAIVWLQGFSQRLALGREGHNFLEQILALLCIEFNGRISEKAIKEQVTKLRELGLTYEILEKEIDFFFRLWKWKSKPTSPTD